jgi:hypothetical protein
MVIATRVPFVKDGPIGVDQERSAVLPDAKRPGQTCLGLVCPRIVSTDLDDLRLFVIFGEHQVMARLIAKRVLISPLINKDFQFATFSSLVAILLP